LFSYANEHITALIFQNSAHERLPMTASQTETVSSQDVSASTLVCLFADQFAALAPAGETGVRSMSSGNVVSVMALGQMMYAVGFARLHRAGLIRLESGSSTRKVGLRRRVVEFPVVNVHLTGDLSTADHQTQDLAAALMRYAKKEPDVQTVRQIVSRVLPGSESPYWHVIGLALDNASRLGYVERTKQGTVHRKIHLEPMSDRIETLRPVANALRDDWKAFRAESSDLADALKDDVHHGIVATKKEERTDEPDDDWG
jgi:hypothetical protein